MNTSFVQNVTAISSVMVRKPQIPLKSREFGDAMAIGISAKVQERSVISLFFTH